MRVKHLHIIFLVAMLRSLKCPFGYESQMIDISGTGQYSYSNRKQSISMKAEHEYMNTAPNYSDLFQHMEIISPTGPKYAMPLPFQHADRQWDSGMQWCYSMQWWR